jgi:Rod binding domain-containing protein
MTIRPMGTDALVAAADPAALAKNQKASEAAKQFESLLIAQMLKTMREEESGWLGTGEDKTADSAMGMAEEHLASTLSAAGGFGLSKVVTKDLQAPTVNHAAGGKNAGRHLI